VIRPAVVLGKFDALHLGHRELVAQACASAGEASLVSFSGMAEVLGWPERLPLIAAQERPRILARWSAELRAPVSETVLDFREVRELTAQDFLALLRQRFATRLVVVGADFRGGRDRQAGAAELPVLAAALGMEARVVPQVVVGEHMVSSSAVRDALGAGEVALARTLLGRPHRLFGTVVRGEGRGRTIGVPTANCGERANLAPAGGVYAGLAWAGGRGPAAAAINIGVAPTVGAQRPLTVEAHLIGATGDLYGQALELAFLARLREERRFASLDELKRQLAQDIARAGELAGPELAALGPPPAVPR
jgi:riboflavin kinase/FMN adenylyltransferase